MPCCSKSSLPITGTYASGADDLPPPSRKPRFTCCANLLRSEILTFLLAIVAELLAVAWYVVVPFIVDTSTLHSKYTFEPMSVSSYTAWAIAMCTLLPVLIGWTGFALAADGRGRRWMLYLGTAVYILLLVVGNAIGASQTHKREAFEAQFAVKFNDFYCDTRTLRVCLDGSSRTDLLTLTRGGSNATTSETSSDDAALAIWSRCREVMLQEMDKDAKRDQSEEGDDETGEKEIETVPLYRFLDDCNGSHATDLWCGDVLHRTTPLTDAEQRQSPAPFAVNPGFYEDYKREWPKRLLYSNALVGSAIGCLVVAALASKAGQKLGGSY